MAPDHRDPGARRLGLTTVITSPPALRAADLQVGEHGLTSGPRWPRATRITRCRSADILNDMDSRASDRIPGARVRFKRHVPAQPLSDARPREWLALADGA